MKEMHLDETRIQNHAIVFRSDAKWYKNTRAYIERMTPVDIIFAFHSNDPIDCGARRPKPSQYHERAMRNEGD